MQKTTNHQHGYSLVTEGCENKFIPSLYLTNVILFQVTIDHCEKV